MHEMHLQPHSTCSNEIRKIQIGMSALFWLLIMRVYSIMIATFTSIVVSIMTDGCTLKTPHCVLLTLTGLKRNMKGERLRVVPM